MEEMSILTRPSSLFPPFLSAVFLGRYGRAPLIDTYPGDLPIHKMVGTKKSTTVPLEKLIWNDCTM